MAMRYAEYYALRRQLAPGLRSNQECYASVLDRLVTPTTRWLDAGCGHQVFPWAPELEAALVERAAFAAGCDLDEPAMRKHPPIRRVASADLEALPYREASFTLLSANMVVEHIARPAAVFSEFARVLAPGGQVVLHTPNAWSYFVLAARCVPERYRRRLASHIDGRPLEDVFPTHYRANRPRRITRLLKEAGFSDVHCLLVASDATIQQFRWIAIAELLILKATLTHWGRAFRASLIVTATRPPGA